MNDDAPLVKGGQGRADDELISACDWLMIIFLCAVGSAIIAYVVD